MQSYRKRIAVQMKHKEVKPSQTVHKSSVKKSYSHVKEYLLKAIRMHESLSKQFAPLSDEWKVCLDDLQKYKIDYEILERGTYDERKGVIEKYGR